MKQDLGTIYIVPQYTSCKWITAEFLSLTDEKEHWSNIHS